MHGKEKMSLKLELAKEAGIPTWNHTKGGHELPPDVERLIDLVIEECGRVAFNHILADGSFYYINTVLRNHFVKQ